MKQKVIVAMSGGVDSSVAAFLMKKKGFDVTGVFLKCWSDSKDFSGECTWKNERRSAQKVCEKLKIPLITVDAEKEYKKYVVNEMFNDYKKGITPNPDILCNETVKFPFLFEEAKKLGANNIVTGHFVRIKKFFNGKYFLQRGSDESKDQSYFLYRLKESDLKKLIFPIGKYAKPEVRKIAKKAGFENHEKKSTVGICFIGKTNMKDFLKTKIKPRKGKIIDPNGNVVGYHDGIYYYTIGQKIGSKIDLEIDKHSDDKRKLSKWYVAKKDIEKNILVVAPEGHKILLRKEMALNDFHLITEDPNKIKNRSERKGLKVYSRIRHVGELIPSRLKYNSQKKRFELFLSRAITGVSNGQAAVLYKNRNVFGGGTITDL